jgi:hypothetical protein
LGSSHVIGAWYSGLCGEGCCSSCLTAWGRGDDWRFFLHFPWSYEPCVTSGGSEVVSPDDWLMSIIWFILYTQCRLQLQPEVTHFQFVQGGAICCFCQAAAVLHYCCNSVWSATFSTRWGCSVLSTAFSPRRVAQ